MSVSDAPGSTSAGSSRETVSYRTHRILDLIASDRGVGRIAGRVITTDLLPTGVLHLVVDDGSAQLDVVESTHLDADEATHLRGAAVGSIVSLTVERGRSGPDAGPVFEISDARILGIGAEPLPSFEEWVESEERWTSHELGLVHSPEMRSRFVQRSEIVSSLRRQLEARGFIEVETPILSPQRVMAPVHDFALAPPRLGEPATLRTTNTDVMRRLVFAGFERVFQIGKNFRDEPRTFKNYSEFTMLTFGLAFATYDEVMRLVEEVVSTAAFESLQTFSVHFRGHQIDLAPPWRRLTMTEAVREFTGVDLESPTFEHDIHRFLSDHGTTLGDSALREEVIDRLITDFVFPNLIHPTFLTEFPFHFGGPAKEVHHRPGFKQRCELFVSGVEIMNMSTHQDDPVKLRLWFDDLLAEKEAKGWGAQVADDAYFRCMNYGAVPCSSGGLGVDRLVMLLTGSESVEEVVLFPWRDARS
jgi:lysyl-tRNA synthetase class 2